MLDTVAIVQARMGSKRLPGKSLMLVWRDRSLLEMVLCRIQQALTVDEVILATSDQPQDDALVDVAIRCGADHYRGDEQDVLGRFFSALKPYPADAVVRICADNPLVDPEEVDKLVTYFWHNQPCDYATNQGYGLPDGVGAEIISFDVLVGLDNQELDVNEREHVTLHVKKNSHEYRTALLQADAHLQRPHYRLDVDYQYDLEFIRTLCELLPKSTAPYWSTGEILNTLDKNPELVRTRKSH